MSSYLVKRRWMRNSLLVLLFTIAVYGTAIAQSWDTVGIAHFSAGEAYSGTVAIDRHGTAYVAYTDMSCGLYQATVKKINGSSWVNVGSPCFTTNSAICTSIAIGKADTPYLAFSDASYGGGKATVMKYDGTSWVYVGTPGISAGVVSYISLVMDSAGAPYVAFNDGGYGNKASVMKYDGSSWVNVGSPGFSLGWSQYEAMVIDRSGTPFVVYQDDASSWKATVMKFNGTGWVSVGSPAFTPDTAQFTSIALDTAGIPYIAFAGGHYSGSTPAYVMKFNGTGWSAVGTGSISVGTTQYTSIVFSSDNKPYVCYPDFGAGARLAVKRFNGSSWVIVGPPYISPGITGSAYMAISNRNELYVCYSDESGVPATGQSTVMKYGAAPIAGTTPQCIGVADTLADTTSAGFWSSSNTSVAVIASGSGIVTAVSAGIATISYTVSGISSIITLTVNPKPYAGGITSAMDAINTDTFCYSVSLTDTGGVPGGMWRLTNTAVATISPSGLVMPMEYGHQDTVLYIAGNTCGSDTASFKFVITWCPDAVKTVEANDMPLLSAYPNPTEGTFIVNVSSQMAEDITIVVTNMLGEKVKQITTTTNTETGLMLAVPRGIYFVSTVTSRGLQSIRVEVE